MSSNSTVKPYPVQYVSDWTTTGGMPVVIRPIRPEDEPLMVKFHGTLSEQSVYLRYFHMEKLDSRVAHARLMQKCFIDYDREMALVADRQDPSTGEHEILAVGRMTKVPDSCEAEVAVLVSDQAQKQGLGDGARSAADRSGARRKAGTDRRHYPARKLRNDGARKAFSVHCAPES